MAAQYLQIDARFTALQGERGMYQELGGQLEAYAAKYPGRAVEAGALAQAAQAFLAEGDREAELRVMRKALARNALSGAVLDRYLTLLAAHHHDELLDVARSNSPAAVRNRAVQFAIAADAPELPTRWCALAAIPCPRCGLARSPRLRGSISEIMLPASTAPSRLRSIRVRSASVCRHRENPIRWSLGRYGFTTARVTATIWPPPAVPRRKPGCPHRLRPRLAIRTHISRSAMRTPARGNPQKQSPNLNTCWSSIPIAVMRRIASPACCGRRAAARRRSLAGRPHSTPSCRFKVAACACRSPSGAAWRVRSPT